MDWAAQYDAGEMPWDEGVAHPALLDFIGGSDPFQGRVLVPGCGQGHEVRAASTAGNQVIGLDIAPGAIERSRSFPKTGGEEYMVGDLFNLPQQMRGSFDWVIEHTCFCAIDPGLRGAYAEAVAGALKPGGHLFAVFYLDPAADHQPPYGVSVAELDRLFRPHLTVLREWAPVRTFEERKGRELVRLHLKGNPAPIIKTI